MRDILRLSTRCKSFRVSHLESLSEWLTFLHREGTGRQAGHGTTEMECRIKDCTKAVLARQMCRSHYDRERVNGLGICSIDGCENHQRQVGLCNKHYIAKFRDDLGTCSVAGCDAAAIIKGVCSWHDKKRRMTGGIENPRFIKDVVSYKGAHDRVRAARGFASEYECTMPLCPRMATDWALMPGASEVIVDAQNRRYSCSPDDYQPYCRHHHIFMDAAARALKKVMAA